MHLSARQSLQAASIAHAPRREVAAARCTEKGVGALQQHSQKEGAIVSVTKVLGVERQVQSASQVTGAVRVVVGVVRQAQSASQV